MGKTHLAVALGLKAIEHGYGVYFVRAHQLLEDLRRAQAENRLERRMRVYLAPKMLIIDEFGVWPYDRMAATILFSLVSAGMNGAVSSSLQTRASLSGEKSLVMRWWPRPSWTDCCTTATCSTSAATVTGCGRRSVLDSLVPHTHVRRWSSLSGPPSRLAP